MEYVLIFLNGAFNAFIIGMGVMMFIFICAIIVLLEQSIAETIQENHKNIKHYHITSITIIVLTFLFTSLSFIKGDELLFEQMLQYLLHPNKKLALLQYGPF